LIRYFRNRGEVYGPAAIGVILTGNLDDGTAGLWAVKKMGGTAMSRIPADAMFPAMPANATRHVNVDHCVPLVRYRSIAGASETTVTGRRFTRFVLPGAHARGPIKIAG
jgi:two-component system chemotaxis response regulator CheB